MKRICFFCGILVFVGCYFAQADVVHLKNGRTIVGNVVVQDENVVEIDIGAGSVSVNPAEVERVEEAAEDIVFKSKRKWGLEKVIDKIRGKWEQYLRRKRTEKAVKELHDLRVKEYELTQKKEAAASRVSGSEMMEAANKASMDAHNAQIKAMKEMAESMKEMER